MENDGDEGTMEGDGDERDEGTMEGDGDEDGG